MDPVEGARQKPGAPTPVSAARPASRSDPPVLVLVLDSGRLGEPVRAEVAELVARIVSLAGSGIAEAPGPADVDEARRRKRERESRELRAALDRSGGNLSQAARALGLSRGAVVYRARKYGLLRA